MSTGRHRDAGVLAAGKAAFPGVRHDPHLGTGEVVSKPSQQRVVVIDDDDDLVRRRTLGADRLHGSQHVVPAVLGVGADHDGDREWLRSRGAGVRRPVTRTASCSMLNPVSLRLSRGNAVRRRSPAWARARAVRSSGGGHPVRRIASGYWSATPFEPDRGGIALRRGRPPSRMRHRAVPGRRADHGAARSATMVRSTRKPSAKVRRLVSPKRAQPFQARHLGDPKPGGGDATADDAFDLEAVAPQHGRGSTPPILDSGQPQDRQRCRQKAL